MLLLMLVSICLLGYYAEPIMQKLGVQTAASSRRIPPQRAGFIIPGAEAEVKEVPVCMSLEEYAAQAKSNPDAYYRLLNCGEPAGERTEFDKLMNFFTRLKYE